MKWVTEIGNFDIKFSSHTTIKGQVLEDFTSNLLQKRILEHGNLLWMEHLTSRELVQDSPFNH